MAIALEFPAPSAPKDPLRQTYIEVWEADWLGGDPEANFKEDIEQDPAEGKSLTSIEGVPALVVTAHSSSDDDRANPAFVRVVVDGVDVHISGGEDLDALIRITAGLIRGAEG